MKNHQELVRNIQRGVHFLPVTPSRKREINFHKMYQIERGDVYQYEVCARETLNSYDLSVLLAVLYVYQNKLATIEYGGEINNMEYTELVKLTVPMTTLCQIAGLRGNYRDRQRVWDSLQRISDAYWRWYINQNGKIKTQKTTIIYEVDRTALIKHDKIEYRNFIIFANKHHLEKTNKPVGTLLVSFSYIKLCKTDIGKLLIYWLCGQKNNTYQEIILFKALLMLPDIYTPHEARRKLKTALTAATECGYLTEWSIEKRYSINYYHIVRKRS